jgi:hypothetical protein
MPPEQYPSRKTSEIGGINRSGGVELNSETKSGPRRANVRAHGTGTEVQVQDDPNDFSAEYGIWTRSDGGFCEGPLYGRVTAERRLADLIAEDPENAEDLSVEPMPADEEDDDNCDGECIGCDAYNCDSWVGR